MSKTELPQFILDTKVQYKIETRTEYDDDDDQEGRQIKMIDLRYAEYVERQLCHYKGERDKLLTEREAGMKPWVRAYVEELKKANADFLEQVFYHDYGNSVSDKRVKDAEDEVVKLKHQLENQANALQAQYEKILSYERQLGIKQGLRDA